MKSKHIAIAIYKNDEDENEGYRIHKLEGDRYLVYDDNYTFTRKGLKMFIKKYIQYSVINLDKSVMLDFEPSIPLFEKHLYESNDVADDKLDEILDFYLDFQNETYITKK